MKTTAVLLALLLDSALFFRMSAQNSWSEIALPITNTSLSNISFADSTHGCLCGSDGTFLYTSDNGRSWSVDTIPTPLQIVKCRMVSEDVAWAFAIDLSGQSTIFMTTDRGASWSVTAVPDTLPALGAAFLSEQIAYATTATHCWKTTDGGNTWNQRGRILGRSDPPFPEFYDPMEFLDESIGFIAGTIAPVFVIGPPQKTTDGGWTWIYSWMGTRSPGPGGFASGVPVASGYGGLCTFRYFTVDDIGYWNHELILSWNNLQDTIVLPIPFQDGTGYARGFALDRQNIWRLWARTVRRTTNGGSFWIADTLPVHIHEILVDRLGHRLALGSGKLFRFTGGPNSAEPFENVPSAIILHQNYPNPFNPGTTITFSLPHATDGSLRVFDVLGREVATLVDGVQNPGHTSVQWNATGMAGGIYFYRLQVGSFVETKRLVLLR